MRRIEAITGKQTLEELRSGQEKLIRAALLLKTTSNEPESRIGGMLSEMKEIKSQLEKFKEQASLGEARTFLTSAKEVKGLKLVTAQRDGMDANALRKLGDFLRDKEPKIVGVLASVKDGKVTLLAVCGKEAVASGIKAGDIIKAIAPICGGKGGGKPDSAMGGGTEVSKVDDALAAVDDSHPECSADGSVTERSGDAAERREMKLHDFYDSLDALCDDLDVARESIEASLARHWLHLIPKKNKFV